MDPIRNPFKQALKSGRLQLGLWHSLASHLVVEILANSGFDWILIDTEHSPNELPMVLTQLQAMGGGTAHAVVRPAWNDPVVIKRLLDVGAQSLLIPYVETEEEAERAVQSVRYPPRGFRGFASQARASRYGRIKGYHKAADAEICLLLQVETRRGLENLERIAGCRRRRRGVCRPGRSFGRARLSRPAEPPRYGQDDRRRDPADQGRRQRARNFDRRSATGPALYRAGLPLRRRRLGHRNFGERRRTACGKVQEPEPWRVSALRHNPPPVTTRRPCHTRESGYPDLAWRSRFRSLADSPLRKSEVVVRWTGRRLEAPRHSATSGRKGAERNRIPGRVGASR